MRKQLGSIVLVFCYRKGLSNLIRKADDNLCKIDPPGGLE